MQENFRLGVYNCCEQSSDSAKMIGVLQATTLFEGTATSEILSSDIYAVWAEHVFSYLTAWSVLNVYFRSCRSGLEGVLCTWRIDFCHSKFSCLCGIREEDAGKCSRRSRQPALGLGLMFDKTDETNRNEIQKVQCSTSQPQSH